MREYYTFDTQQEAINCINYINGTSWFPIVGKVNGVPAPQNTKTTVWVEAPKEMLNGRYAVPRIPDSRLDYLEVPEADRTSFLSAFGQDIQTLTNADFPVIEEEV